MCVLSFLRSTVPEGNQGYYMPKLGKKKAAKKKASKAPAKKNKAQGTIPLQELLEHEALEPADNLRFDRVWLFLHGLQGSGKTTCAWSLANEWEGFPRRDRKKKVQIVSTIGLGVDVASVSGLLAQGYQIPYYIDLRGLMYKKECDIYDAWEYALDFVYEAIEKDPRIENIILDPLSTLAALIEAYWHHKDRMPQAFNKRSQKLEPDTRGFWGQVKWAHQHFSDSWMDIPLRRVVCCHSRAARDEGDVGSAAEKKRIQMLSGIAQAAIVPDCSGMGLEAWTRPATLELYLEPQKLPKGNAPFKYWAYGYGSETDARTKNRWLDALAEKEPADLQHILKKVRDYANG